MSKFIWVKHKKGRHKSKPFKLKRLSNLKASVIFLPSCRYNHGNNDQKDWNKLLGVKKRFFSPRENSILIGWRYNTDTDEVELIPYIHYKGAVIKDYVPVKVKVGIITDISIDEDLVKIKDRYFDVPRDWKKGWYVNSWFGGQKKSPHDILILVRIEST